MGNIDRGNSRNLVRHQNYYFAVIVEFLEKSKICADLGKTEAFKDQDLDLPNLEIPPINYYTQIPIVAFVNSLGDSYG